MRELNKEIGAKIWNMREHLEISREKLGEMTGLSNRFIYDIETGRKGMSAESLFKISDALGVTCDHIMSELEITDISVSYEILCKLDKKDLKYAEKILWTFYKAVKERK